VDVSVTPVLNYSNVRNVRPRREIVLLLAKGGIFLILACGFFSLLFIPLREDEMRMDAITGSVQHQTFWPRRMTFGPVFTPSPLELRLKKMGVTWTPAWTFVCGPERTIFGSTVVSVCGSTPPIGGMCGNTGLQMYVDNASDAEVLELVHILQTGTDAQQKAAMEVAFRRALE
jgi:hypothetical protein